MLPAAVVSAEEFRAGGAPTLDCQRYEIATWLEGIAFFAAGLGPALAAFILLASWLAGRSRLLLLVLFVPGLYLTLGGLLLLVGLQGLLALGVLHLIWTGGAALPVFVPLAIGGATLYGVVNLAYAVLTSARRPLVAALGRAVSEADAPGLWREVRDLAARLGARAPTNIVVGLEPGFWVTEAAVRAPNGQLGGRTMYLSLPFCRVLTRPELSSILGHELAHYRGLDTRFSRMFYPVYRGTAQSLAALDHATDESVVSWLTLMPAQIVLEFFYNRFAEAENRIGRRRELAADRAGAEVTSPLTAATALVKAHAFDRSWHGVRGLMRGALHRGQALPNVGLAYAEVVRRDAVPSVLEGLDEQRLAHPTDSHPPLHARLAALGLSLTDVGPAALAVSPADPAIGLIENAEEVERELSASTSEEMLY
jgi:Zn-dependent protease with chaperone function